MDVDSDILSTVFISLFDSISFAQKVDNPTHYFIHTLDLVVTYGIEIEQLIFFPQNPLLSDRCLITFELLLLDYTPLSKNVFTSCLADGAVALI